jgi:hypothetical protein
MVWRGVPFRSGNAYRKADDPFQFRIEGDKVSGFTVELEHF